MKAAKETLNLLKDEKLPQGSHARTLEALAKSAPELRWPANSTSTATRGMPWQFFSVWRSWIPARTQDCRRLSDRIVLLNACACSIERSKPTRTSLPPTPPEKNAAPAGSNGFGEIKEMAQWRIDYLHWMTNVDRELGSVLKPDWQKHGEAAQVSRSASGRTPGGGGCVAQINALFGRAFPSLLPPDLLPPEQIARASQTLNRAAFDLASRSKMDCEAKKARKRRDIRRIRLPPLSRPVIFGPAIHVEAGLFDRGGRL